MNTLYKVCYLFVQTEKKLRILGCFTHQIKKQKFIGKLHGYACFLFMFFGVKIIWYMQLFLLVNGKFL